MGFDMKSPYSPHIGMVAGGAGVAGIYEVARASGHLIVQHGGCLEMWHGEGKVVDYMLRSTVDLSLINRRLAVDITQGRIAVMEPSLLYTTPAAVVRYRNGAWLAERTGVTRVPAGCMARLDWRLQNISGAFFSRNNWRVKLGVAGFALSLAYAVGLVDESTRTV